MKVSFLATARLASMLAILFSGQTSYAATKDAAQGKQDDKPKGYVFFANHDEIVAGAKKEGKLSVLANLEMRTIKTFAAAFKKKYPFIGEVNIEQTTGTESAQRIVLGLQAGTIKADAIHILVAFRDDYTPSLWKVDILGMAKERVLDIPIPMIDPKHRNTVAIQHHFQPVAYNSKMVNANVLPKSWEDFLRPEFKGKKFALDVRPKDISALVPVWGLEKTLAYARKLAMQEPIWIRGSRALVSMIAGEIPMVVGPNFGAVKRLAEKDHQGVMGYVIPEPVPVRFGGVQGLVANSRSPHAGVLWLEWLANPETQRMMDQLEYSSSVYVRGSLTERELRGKKLSLVDWQHYHEVDEWEKDVAKAYGFPEADRQK
jgi:ABC-type glycerol-3-phosphate transport system substrate-binding protein